MSTKLFASYIIGSDLPLSFGSTMRECADNANKASVEWGDTLLHETVTTYPTIPEWTRIESLWNDHISGKTYVIVTRPY